MKSTLCLCDLFSHHFLQGAAAREQDKLAFWPPALWALKKKQALVRNRGKKRREFGFSFRKSGNYLNYKHDYKTSCRYV